MLRRTMAVAVDFFVLYALWVAVGLYEARRNRPEYAGLGIAVFLVLIDLPLTALFGLSMGRAVAGIRVLRVADGQAPGWARAALRVTLVAITGPVGLLFWTVAEAAGYYFHVGLGSRRMWWDAAAGTALVRPTSR